MCQKVHIELAETEPFELDKNCMPLQGLRGPEYADSIRVMAIALAPSQFAFRKLKVSDAKTVSFPLF